jgi:ATP-dependent Clp protease protease subunit
MVVEADGRHERSFDIYSRLLRERIVFLGREVDDEIANVTPRSCLPRVGGPGQGHLPLRQLTGRLGLCGHAGDYDTMQYVKPDVSTICVGMGMSAAAMILAGGAAGKRMALPNAKVMIHQGSAGYRGTPADIEIHAHEVLAMTKPMAEILAKHTGPPFEPVMLDIDRDRFMTPGEAVRVRLVDKIVEPRAVSPPSEPESPTRVLGHGKWNFVIWWCLPPVPDDRDDPWSPEQDRQQPGPQWEGVREHHSRAGTAGRVSGRCRCESAARSRS